MRLSESALVNEGMDTEQILRNISNALVNIQQYLDILNCEDSAEKQEKLELLESAKLDVASAYSLATLMFMYLRVKGVSVVDHPIHNELARIKGEIGKLNQLERSNSVEKTRPRVNEDAAQRIVKHYAVTR